MLIAVKAEQFTDGYSLLSLSLCFGKFFKPDPIFEALQIFFTGDLLGDSV